MEDPRPVAKEILELIEAGVTPNFADVREVCKWVASLVQVKPPDGAYPRGLWEPEWPSN